MQSADSSCTLEGDSTDHTCTMPREHTHTLHTGIHTAQLDLHILVLAYHTHSTSRHRSYVHTSHTHSHA